MKKDKWFFLWLTLGLLGLIIAIFDLFIQSDRSLDISLPLARKEVLRVSDNFLISRGFEADQYCKDISLVFDHKGFLYLQKIKKDISAKHPSLYYWKVDYTLPLLKKGDSFEIDVGPQRGEVLGFRRRIRGLSAEKEKVKVTEPEAKTIAEEFLASVGLEPTRFELQEDKTIEKDERTQHSFIWKDPDYRLGSATPRIQVDLTAGEVSDYRQYLLYPDRFSREIAKYDIIEFLISILAFLFYVLLGLIILIAVIARFRYVDWRFGLPFGVVIFLISVLAYLNKDMWDLKLRTFHLVTSIAWSFLIGIWVMALCGLARSLAQRSPGYGLKGPSTSWRKRLFSEEIVRPIQVGYCLAFIHIGLSILIFNVLKKFSITYFTYGGISPLLSGVAIPWLGIFALAAETAIKEEVIFRFLPITFLKRHLKSTLFILFIPAIFWASLHIAPFGAVGIWPSYFVVYALLPTGILAGWFFLKYGLASVIVAHYLINSLIFGVACLFLGNSELTRSGIFAITLALIPAIFACFVKSKKYFKRVQCVTSSSQ